MPFFDVLVHRATPIVTRQGPAPDVADWVEGDYGEPEEVPGAPFDCVLFLPQGSSSPEGRGRRVREPTLLYADYADGTPVALPDESQVDVVAPELNRAEGRPEDAAVRWQVVGQPQPFGKPGFDVLGYQATLRRVEDA